jgi:N-acetylmuramoyl-L-alanine amidase
MPTKFIKPKKRKRSAKSINDIFSEVEMVNRDNRRKYTIESTKEDIESLPIIGNSASKHDLIVIDAGHGGHDSGAVGAGKREKDLVLSIAKKVSKH